jgi:hypothetical protein
VPYESWYLRAVDPARPRGVWIRYTTRDGEPTLWCTLFEEDGVTALRRTVPAWPAGSTHGPDRMTGEVEADGHSARWELELAGSAQPLRHLPAEWMYRAPLPRTKLESPRPDAVVSGRLEVDGRRIDVAGWRGMAGHNWGAEHAEQWVWLHVPGFAGDPEAWLDLALGRVRVGGVLTPWTAAGALCVDGERRRVRGLARVRVARPEALELRVGRVHVAVRAAPARTVTWDYDGERTVTNCSVAELRARVERRRRPALELASAHGAAYELGRR